MGTKKYNIPCCLACLLFVLVMITTYMTSGLYARYTTKATDSDSARVAKFDVDITGDVKDLDVVASKDKNTGIYEIKITNNSEVVVKYKTKLEFISGNAEVVNGIFEKDSGNIDINETKIITLSFSVVNQEEFTKDKTGKTASETIGFKVIVDVEQVD